MKRLLLVLLLTAAFAALSCGEKAETVTDEGATSTQLARDNESPVSTCEDNVCTHEVASSRECAVEGICPGKQHAAAGGHPCMGACGDDCTCASGGACTCGGKGECMYAKERGTGAACQAHVCTEACPKDCPHAKAHVCTEACPKDCPHAKAAQAPKADGCAGCPLKTSCKSGS